MIVDQLVNRTHSREGTFFDGPDTVHLPFTDPFDAGLGGHVARNAREIGLTVRVGGTVVVNPGPRFSTRAQSAWHAAMGWDVVNRTQAPEAALAAEAGVAYVGIGMITDHDAGTADDSPRPASHPGRSGRRHRVERPPPAPPSRCGHTVPATASLGTMSR